MNAYVSYAAPIAISSGDLTLGQMPNEIEYLVILFASVKSSILALKSGNFSVNFLLPLSSYWRLA